MLTPSKPLAPLFIPKLDNEDNVGDAEAPQNKDLNRLTVPELRAIAKENGIVGYSDMKKSELIKVLE